ncbi:MAG: hypothetical protein JOZ07_17930 [Solirubrobacterales bacterium]|nr:hypothetical protein [Solirubrobacterales bacterium]
MWLRWVVSLAVGAILLGALIVYVDHHNTDGPVGESPRGAARANREAEIVVAQDQAPRTARTAAGEVPRVAAVRAIRADMNRRIADGDAGEPLQRVSCRQVATQGPRLGLRCTAVSAGVNYPYQAVLDVRDHRITYCKHDAPPVASQNIPVSRRCVA